MRFSLTFLLKFIYLLIHLLNFVFFFFLSFCWENELIKQKMDFPVKLDFDYVIRCDLHLDITFLVYFLWK